MTALRSAIHRRFLLGIGICGIWAAGCAHPAPTSPTLVRPAPTPQRVELTNLTSRTASSNASPDVSGEELLGKLSAMQTEPGFAARAVRLLRRYPDAALELLRNTTAGQAAQPDRQALAKAYDHAFVSGKGQWYLELTQAVERPKEFNRLVEARHAALQWIEMGRPEQVSTASPVPDHGPFPCMQAEVLRVSVIALLLQNRASDAIRDCRRAQALVQEDCSVCSELCLLESQALLRLGDQNSAAQRWAVAANAAIAVHDPALWQRLIEARPVSASWPPNVSAAFSMRLHEPTTSPAFVSEASASSTEAFILRQAGEWRLARGETAAALLDFKQAETLFREGDVKSETRIAQARALLLMNQGGAAVSILSSLISDPHPVIKHGALAVLANARLAQDDLVGALSLFQRAVDGDEQFTASLRANARADYGLALLMSSHEQEGLTWLHKAQADFEQAEDDAGLVQCLRNEAAYFDTMGHTDASQALRNRAVAVAARN